MAENHTWWIASRRDLLAGIGAAGAIALAGCLGDDGDGGGGSDPTEVVASLYESLDDGDADGANDLIHSDSPEGAITDENVGFYEEADIAVEGTELLDEGDDAATVSIDLSFGEGLDDETYDVEVRLEDGEWKVWQQQQ